ncbi:MAG: 2,3-bisphosphoglycerate-independent phosphoglycerate mutase, partial [Patescibacteria group bacterium]|nr:2,3-bisphosphoglycerate-independent phosphoglycerate mutase [Patescibacteria group bacterium]
IGTGQVVQQSLPRINKAIKDKRFALIPSVAKTFDEVEKSKSDLHLVGVLSTAGVHGHIEHLFALMKICKKRGIDPFIHVILDGRDTGLNDGYMFLNMLNAKIKDLGIGRIASMCGRFYSMDRDKRWDRTEVGYNAMLGNGMRSAVNPDDVLQEAYKNGENDQIFTPTTIINEDGSNVGVVKDDDVIILYNYREDRVRQLIRAFVQKNFDKFPQESRPCNLYFLSMTSHDRGLPVKHIFKPPEIKTCVASVVSDNGFNKVIRNAGYTQLHISETEKMAHISYFFNGGVGKPHKGEELFVVPSPKVFDYAETPMMSADIVRDEVVFRLNKGMYNFVLINFANPDMLGHTGDLDAAIEGIELVDGYVGDVVRAVIKRNGSFIITADHGCCETMINEKTGEVDVAHTANPVPVIICKNCKEIKKFQSPHKIGTGPKSVKKGIIADLGVTVLSMLGLEPTDEMTGVNLRKVIK